MMKHLDIDTEIKHLLMDDDHPLPPVLCWTGGKAKLANTIVEYIPEHKIYVEPFFGGGSIFWRKPLAEINVINDINSDLMDFYKNLREANCSHLQNCNLPTNQAEFARAIKNRNKSICSFLGVNKRSYACKMDKPRFAFSTAMARGKNIGANNFKRLCDEYKDKLRQAKVLNSDFTDVVNKFDSPDTLFYLDPPFVDTYEYGQKTVNPEDIAKLVKSLKGKAIISYNDHPRVRKAFKGLEFHKVSTDYTIQTSQTNGIHKKVNELLITNFHIGKNNGHLN